MTQSTEERELYPAPIYRWYVVFVLLVAYGFSFGDRMVLVLLLSNIRRALDLNDTQASLLVGFAFVMLYALAGIPLATLADTGRRRRLIIVGSLLWSVMAATCGLAGSFLTLFISRVGVGVGEATLSPAAYSLMSDYFPKRQLSMAISVYTVGAALGAGVALAAGGALIQYLSHLPPVTVAVFGVLPAWRLVFVIVAAAGLVVPLLMLTVREPARIDASAVGGSKADQASFRDMLRFIAARAGTLVPLLAGISLLALITTANVTWVPTFFVRTFHLPVAQAGILYGLIYGIAGAGGLVAGGWWADRWFAKGRLGAHYDVLFYAAMILTPLCAFPLMPTARLAWMMAVPWMFILCLPSGVGVAALQLMTPNRSRGKMGALYLLCVSLVGVAVGPTAVALITDYGFHNDNSLRYSLVMVSVPSALLAAALFAIARRAFAAHMRQSATDSDPGALPPLPVGKALQ